MAGPGPLDPYEVRVAALGAAIRDERIAKRMTQAELGKAVALSNTAIAHFESGAHVPRRDVARRIDDALEVHGRIWRLRDELDDSPDAKWLVRYLREQGKATRIRQITPFMPAMLETAEHTRLALESGLPFYGGDLQEKIEYRAKMRAILDKPRSPTLCVMVWETALRCVLGSSRVMREQLLHLISRSHAENVELRLLPFDVGTVFVETGFVTIIDRPRARPLAYRPAGRLGMFIAGRAAVDDLVCLYDHLYGLSLPPDESRAFVGKVVEEIYPCLSPDPTCP
ncbi:helix-turn-helix transcriptional regulator [Streptomyces luteireticuli]|uniref:Helix-turn-helix transcriptional regulator n=1 Tax=Streptomyces luteireticuli TaxID=173858 RepID=A0ABN0Z4S8_9ACTN